MEALTLILVHGGSVTSRAWDPVLAHLRTPAIAIDLPGRRFRPADLGTIRRRDWEDAVVADVTAAGGPVVLVGHSSGGYVIPGAAARLGGDVVRGLVFVAGTCPGEGLRPVDAMTESLHRITVDNVDNLNRRSAGTTIGDRREGEPPIETDLAVVEVDARMGIEAPFQLFEPVTWVGVPSVPRLYVRAMRDRVIPPEHALTMAANAGAPVVDLDATHDVAGSAPAGLALLIEDFVASLR